MHEHEKAPLGSKKFIAFLVAETTWKIILITALLVFKTELQAATVWGWWFMVSIVLVAGFVEVGFIGGQAWIDRYVRVATLVAKGPQAPQPNPPTPKLEPAPQTTPAPPESSRFEVPPEQEWDGPVDPPTQP